MDKIIVVTDIHRFNSTAFKDWTREYEVYFSGRYEVQVNYPTALASIPVCPFSTDDGTKIHQQLINGGIDSAASALNAPGEPGGDRNRVQRWRYDPVESSLKGAAIKSTHRHFFDKVEI